MGEELLVAGHAVRMLVPHDVATGDQLLVAVPARQVLLVVVLLHRLRVLPGEDQLYSTEKKTPQGKLQEFPWRRLTAQHTHRHRHTRARTHAPHTNKSKNKTPHGKLLEFSPDLKIS